LPVSNLPGDVSFSFAIDGIEKTTVRASKATINARVLLIPPPKLLTLF
jgi:hypothetical protein